MTGILWESGFNEVVLLVFDIYIQPQKMEEKKTPITFWTLDWSIEDVEDPIELQLIHILYHSNYVLL